MSCQALFIEVPLTQAQVSPGVTHNSLRGLSTQAILMGIPFPHTLGCPALAGYSAANTPFTKACMTVLLVGDTGTVLSLIKESFQGIHRQ